ncbi:hypothetical protein D3C76_1104750 [compost metagenome]
MSRRAKPRNRMPAWRESFSSINGRLPWTHCTRSSPESVGSISKGNTWPGTNGLSRNSAGAGLAPAPWAFLRNLPSLSALPPVGAGATGAEGAADIGTTISLSFISEYCTNRSRMPIQSWMNDSTLAGVNKSQANCQVPCRRSTSSSINKAMSNFE